MRPHEEKEGSEAPARNNMFRSLSKGNQLIMGDPSSRTAIVSLWTRKEVVQKVVDGSMYAIIGQLYSPQRGIDILVRNLLANPQITNLIITGKDIVGSGLALADFFRKGVQEERTNQGILSWKIVSKIDAYIGKDIKKSDLDALREGVNLEVIPDPEKVNGFREKNMPERKEVRYKIPKPETETYPGAQSGYLIRKRTVSEAWLQILDITMKFGMVTPTRFDSRQKEIIDIMSIITEEDPSDPVIPDFFPFSKEHFNEYSKRFLSDSKMDGVAYTYGSRMRSFFGQDQVDLVVEKLSRNFDSREAVVSLWDSREDIKEKESPCLNHIWLRVREGRIFMSATLRSNDMFAGYPENALALRLLQERIRKDLEKKGHSLKLGDLIVVSHSAHIYEENWDDARGIVKDNYSDMIGNGLEMDSRGSFYITVDDKNINVDYLSPKGEMIKRFRGRTALGIRDMLVRENVVGTAAHGIYLGVELSRAEHSLISGKDYEQDGVLR